MPPGELGEHVLVEFGQFQRLDTAAVSAHDVGMRILAEVDAHDALGRSR
jgi:hypothetical protein